MSESVVQAKIVRRSRQWSLIWLVPVLALSVASYVGYQAWRSQGQTIEVEFATAAGLEAGKTRVRYKDVEVGKVTQVALSEDLSRVTVSIAMDRTLAKQLHADARLWVVRPRVTTRTISGLGTLLSGAYISLTPGEKGDLPALITGLDEPPTLSGASDGRQFFLSADRLGSMDVGSPVFYRGIAVGEVVSYTLGDDDRMQIQVFIRSPYDRLVKSQTRFWNVSGIEVSMGGDGVKARMESLLSFMQGGLAFENLQQLDEETAVSEGYHFALYPDKDSITQQNPNLKLTYIMNFSGSVAGLSAGSSVQYQGLEVGKVLDIHPRFDTSSLKVELPVLVEIWPERLAIPDDRVQAQALLDKMVVKGLRAQLKPANLLTGQMMVDLDYQENPAPFVACMDSGHEQFPTIATDMEQIVRSVGNVVAKLEKAPLKETVEELHQTAKGLHRLLDEKESNSVLRQTEALLKRVNETLAKMQSLPATVDTTLKQTQETLQTLNKTLATTGHAMSDDSLLQHDMRGLMQEVSRAASAVETLADTLQRQPNSVIFGKE
jgi:paraquat-inducible protein B